MHNYIWMRSRLKVLTKVLPATELSSNTLINISTIVDLFALLTNNFHMMGNEKEFFKSILSKFATFINLQSLEQNVLYAKDPS